MIGMVEMGKRVAPLNIEPATNMCTKKTINKKKKRKYELNNAKKQIYIRI